MTVKANIKRRADGKDYVNINSIQLVVNVSNASINFKYRNIASFIQSTINNMVTANWRIFKRILDPSLKIFVSGILKSTLMPIFNTVAIQDVIRMPNMLF